MYQRQQQRRRQLSPHLRAHIFVPLHLYYPDAYTALEGDDARSGRNSKRTRKRPARERPVEARLENVGDRRHCWASVEAATQAAIEAVSSEQRQGRHPRQAKAQFKRRHLQVKGRHDPSCAMALRIRGVIEVDHELATDRLRRLLAAEGWEKDEHGHIAFKSKSAHRAALIWALNQLDREEYFAQDILDRIDQAQWVLEDEGMTSASPSGATRRRHPHD